MEIFDLQIVFIVVERLIIPLYAAWKNLTQKKSFTTVISVVEEGVLAGRGVRTPGHFHYTGSGPGFQIEKNY